MLDLNPTPPDLICVLSNISSQDYGLQCQNKSKRLLLSVFKLPPDYLIFRVASADKAKIPARIQNLTTIWVSVQPLRSK